MEYLDSFNLLQFRDELISFPSCGLVGNLEEIKTDIIEYLSRQRDFTKPHLVFYSKFSKQAFWRDLSFLITQIKENYDVLEVNAKNWQQYLRGGLRVENYTYIGSTCDTSWIREGGRGLILINDITTFSDDAERFVLGLCDVREMFKEEYPDAVPYDVLITADLSGNWQSKIKKDWYNYGMHQKSYYNGMTYTLKCIDRDEYKAVLEEYLNRGHWEQPLFIYGKDNTGKRSILRGMLSEGHHTDILDLPYYRKERFEDVDGIVKPIPESMRTKFVLQDNLMPYEVSQNNTDPIVYEFGIYYSESRPIENIDIEYCQWLIQQTHRPVIMLVGTWGNRVMPSKVVDIESYHYVCTLEDWEKRVSAMLDYNPNISASFAKFLLVYLHEHEGVFNKSCPKQWDLILTDERDFKRNQIIQREYAPIMGLTPKSFKMNDTVFFSDISYFLLCIRFTNVDLDEDIRRNLYNFCLEQIPLKERICLSLIKFTKAVKHLGQFMLNRDENWTVVDSYFAFKDISITEYRKPSDVYQFAVYKMVISWLEDLGNQENYEPYLNSLEKLDNLLMAWQKLRYNVPNKYYETFAEAFEALFSSDTQVPNMDKTFAELKSEVLRN